MLLVSDRIGSWSSLTVSGMAGAGFVPDSEPDSTMGLPVVVVSAGRPVGVSQGEGAAAAV